MFVRWYLGLIGGLVVGIIYCQEGDSLSTEDEPEVIALLSINTDPKSRIDAKNLVDDQTSEQFACHECTNCNQKSDVTTRVCESGINMCYTIHKRINNTNRIIRRGCSTSKGLCTVPNDDESKAFDSITCCTTHKCNQGIQFKPVFFLLILNLFIIMITI